MGMLQQCVDQRPLDCDMANQTLRTMLKVSELYAFSAQRPSLRTGLKNMLTKITSASDCTTVFSSAYDFHQGIGSLLRSQNDGNLFYDPPAFFKDTVLYLPVTFKHTGSGADLVITVAGLTHHASRYGYLPGSGASNWVGMRVRSVNFKPVEQVMAEFAQSNVGLTADTATQLHMAISGDYPRLWSCSYSVRPLWGCAMPTTPSVTFELVDPSSEKTIEVAMQWTVRYEGDDCDDPESQCEPAEQKVVDCLELNDMANDKKTSKHYSDDVEDGIDLKRYSAPTLTTGSLGSQPENQYVEGPGGSLDMLETYATAAAYVHKSPTGSLTGILRVAAFQGEAMALHSSLGALAVLNPHRLVLDLRGNGGGHICHAMQLASLVSAQGTPAPVWLAAYRSEMTKAMAANQSVDYEREPGFQFRPDNFQQRQGTDGWDVFRNDLWYKEDPSRPGFTAPVEMNCKAFSSILDFEVNFGYESIKMKNYHLLPLSFPKERLIVLVDHYCAGACATFARVMKMNGAAITVKIGDGELGSFAGGMIGDADHLKCQFKAMKAPSELQFNAFQFEGQGMSLPIAASFCHGNMVADKALDLSATLPDVNVPHSPEMSSYSSTRALIALYSAVVANFSPDTDTPMLSPDGGGGGSSVVVGMSFLWFFIGMFTVCCGGFGFVKYQEGGCDAVLGSCSSCCGAIRSHSGYGRVTAVGDGESANAPGSCGAQMESCVNRIKNWRSWMPGGGGSSLQQQYQDLHSGGLEQVARPLVLEETQEPDLPSMAPPTGFVSDGDPMARPADWGASRAPAADWGAPREIPDDQELATYANMPEKDATAPL